MFESKDLELNLENYDIKAMTITGVKSLEDAEKTRLVWDNASN